jgi:hypothetical protein
MRILACKDRSPAGRAQRRGYKCVPDVHAFPRHAIKAGRLQSPDLIHKAHGIVPVIICQDINDVHFFWYGLRLCMHVNHDGRTKNEQMYDCFHMHGRFI